MKLWIGAILNFIYNEIVTHIPTHWIRITFLRIFNKKIAVSAKILMHVKIWNFWEVQIGDRVVINQYCLLDCRRYKIVIDHDTDIGPYTRIWTLGHDPDCGRHSVKGADVIIGHHVWIASGVTVLPGVVIGDGAVVASASVVPKSLPGGWIYTGNPVKQIRKRDNSLVYQLSFTPVLQ